MTSVVSDYAVIGDGHTCALVAATGSIDFLCWPRFDSDACFAALLGDKRHGFWRVAPAGFVKRTSRRYRGATAVLETEHETDTGRVRVTDFMPWHDGHSAIIRTVEGIEGEVRMSLFLRLRFGYGEVAPWAEQHDRGFVAEVGPDRVLLDSPVVIDVEGGDATAHWTVKAGDRTGFVLGYSSATEPLPAALNADALEQATEREWANWIDRFDAPCQWPEIVSRSLVTLRLLIDRDSGGMVAAATLGMPEVQGGSANWDYRYCWLRDSTFTLTALLNAGYLEEARRWRDWILRAVAGEPATMQIVYRTDGGRRLPEHEASWLPGHQGATPVRIGNAAAGQTQLDVFGELLDSFDVAAKAGIERSPRVIEVETAIVRHLETAWDQPGSDIWEDRGDPHCYTYSQAMAWVAIDRFIKAHEDNDAVEEALLVRLRVLRERIHRHVCERGFSSDLGHFVRHQDGDTLDASLLLLPLVGFLPADDPRVAGTIAAIEGKLLDGGLVRRKLADRDGPDEGAFLACSCWLADCYRMQGRNDEATVLLERVIALANDVGLLSEEYHVPSRRLVGNMPQALSHLALVNTALFLSGPVIQRAGG